MGHFLKEEVTTFDSMRRKRSYPIVVQAARSNVGANEDGMGPTVKELEIFCSLISRYSGMVVRGLVSLLAQEIICRPAACNIVAKHDCPFGFDLL